ncbi:terminal uridylyltransferase 4 isoform X2 [Rhinatrema bivittatum]|uniref:terminal uridylyltransferase 4 isoform X2 n=1 Tax=Rhinatrema bivittatum TaxID=194408 RepID=UPI001127B0DF|nr:terminal uridylyltransferase 4 isoform X2 [Rhinatrema bivittatum]
MEESKSLKNGNHELKKSARAGHGDGKGVRVLSNQKSKHKSEKFVKDTGSSSPNRISSNTNKQNDGFSDKPGEIKSCTVNTPNCITGSNGSGSDHQSHERGKKLLSSPAATENMTSTAGKQKVVESFPSRQDTKDDGSKEFPQGISSSECASGTQKLKTMSVTDDSATEDKAEDLAKMKNSVSNSSIPNSDTDNLEHECKIDEATSIAEQQLGLKQAEERLERDYIFRLEKRSPEYTNCQYLCKLCLVHIENIQGAHKHIKEKRHKRNIMEKREEDELRALPPPTPAQVAALQSVLMEAANEQGISEDDFRVRQEIVSEMEKIVQLHLADCSLRMYGSCLTRFAFKTSDINIDIKYPSKMSQPSVLIQVLEVLKNSALYSDVESDFHAKVPVVFCKDIKSGLTCKVSAGNDVACLTTDLLSAVGKLEPVLVPLVLAFRYWARLCHVDCQAEGGIPSYSFALMVMFFLQQRKPPILPAYPDTWAEGFDLKRIDDLHLKGVEDETFLQWEYKPSGQSKNSGGVEGKAKTEQQESGARRAASSEIDSQNNSVKERHGKSPLVFEKPHQVSLGQLWLELLKFYTLEFALEDYVISIRVQELLTRESKNWPKRRIAIEDPFALKRNVARCLNSQMVFEYILERFKTAYKYFACPQTKSGNKSKPDIRRKEKAKMISKKPAKSDESETSELESALGKETAESECGTSMCERAECNGLECTSSQWTDKQIGGLEINNLDAGDSTANVDGLEIIPLSSHECCEVGQNAHQMGENVESSGSEEKPSHSCNQPSSHDPKAANESADDGPSLGTVCSQKGMSATSHHHKATGEAEDLKDEESFSSEEIHYVFDLFILTSGKLPTIVCSICKREGHSKTDCPEDFKKIDLKPLPPMTNRFRETLDKVCRRCFELSPHTSEQQSREQILVYLERFIQKEFNEKARLCLFGSSKNGFGFRDSDLDICMTLEGHENAEKLNCKEIIEGLAKVLKKHPGLRNILPITTAKVPIVKFEHRESGLEGDISLYNTLAQHNTRMLATYAAIDPRVKYLGYTMKVFAKRCDIGDASRGSLSSYAYILMVLYFLQQRKPPVIPVLQEIFDGKQIPVRIVDGWNAFFFDNVEELRKRLPSFGKNVESVGELWLGLLRFYTEEFDFKEYVISIRQKKLLTTFEKQWTSKCIAIEDPFDLNHNLGAGVSRRMTNFIMKAFINGRKLFGTPFYPQPGREVEYFFDSKVLTDGELAPNDRCCRVCGKIGHYMKDCPKRRRNFMMEITGFTFSMRNEAGEEVPVHLPRVARGKSHAAENMLHDAVDDIINSRIKKKENEKDDDKDVREEERESREKRCFTCGDAGHVRRDCPENRVRQRNNVLTSQFLRSLMGSQPVLVPVPQQLERPARSRQSSECSESHQTSYSPQPQQFPQNSPQPASINQTQPPQSTSQPKHVQQQSAPQPPHQVQLPLFNYPHSPPGQFSTLHSLGLLPVHHQIQLPNSAWPVHGPVVHPSPGNPHSSGVTFSVRPGSSSITTTTTNNQNNVSLNDPSIIFAQPAARSMGIPSTSHEGHWHSPMTPTSLLSNGTVGNSDQRLQGQFGKLNPSSIPWDQFGKLNPPAPFPLLSASWPYNLPQNYMQQGNTSYQANKAFYPQAGPLMQNNQRFSVLSQAHPHVNYVQQKK